MDFNFDAQPGLKKFERKPRTVGKPLVSIVTPFYNAGRYIRQTANCIFNQTFPHFEWIIVNDGSTNREDIQLLEELTREDNRVKVYHKENGGISTARNLGIKKADADIVAILDADDLLEPTYLECAYFSLLTNPEAGWSYTDSVGFQNMCYLWKKPFSVQKLKRENFLTEMAVFRKEALFKVGLYDESEKHFYEDWHMWLKLLRQGIYPLHLGYYGAWYRRIDNGVLGLVNRDPQKHARAMAMIGSVAREVDDSLRAVEYPKQSKNNFKAPSQWEWDRPPILDDAKCKVLMILPWMVMGGSDRFNLDLVSRIDRDRFEISIITTMPSKFEWRQRFEAQTADVFDLSAFLDLKHWSAFIHYFIKSRAIDTVMVSNSYYGYYLIPWLRKEFPKLPVVDFVHMEEWYWRAGGYARTSWALGNITDKTYVISQHLKDVLTADFHREAADIEVVYLNVDEKYFDPEVYQKGVARKEAGVATEDPVVLFPCRIQAQKRPFLMLEIAAETRKIIPNIRFFVVGDGPDLSNLREEARKRGLEKTVRFFGARREMPQFYRDSDLTLLCSIKEGLALTAYESLAMGVPVISSDVGGQRELIDGAVGRLLPLMQDEAGDFNNREYSETEIRQYVAAIQILLNDQKALAEMRINCRRQIMAKYTKQKMISRLEAEFSALKEGKGSAKRGKTAAALAALPNLADDYLTLYLEWFENEYNGLLTTYTAADFIRTAKTRPTFIWGAGSGGRKTWEHLQSLNIDVQGFIDRDPDKAGTIYCDLPVYAPGYLRESISTGKNPFIFIGSMYFEAIRSALEESGLEENVDFLNCAYVF